MIETLKGIYETVEYHDIKGVRIHCNNEYENYPLHWHTAVEIIMPIHSSYTTEICNIKSTYGQGDIFLIPPGEIHSLFAPPSGKRLIFLFDYTLINHFIGMDSLLHTLQPFVMITEAEYPLLRKKLSSYLLQIYEEYISHNPYKDSYIYSLLILFFVELGRTTINATTKFPGITSNKQQEYIEKYMAVCTYISEHCCENLTVDYVAGRIGFSKFHFMRLFKQFTGSTYTQYLTQKRIQHAEKLLIHPDLSVTEIALQSGFNSLSTFNRLFKSHKDCSPSDYRTFKNKKEVGVSSIEYHTSPIR